MIVIGLDVHKQSVTAVAVDEAGRPLSEKVIPVGSDELLDWAGALDAVRLWAVEDCRQLTRWLERQLLAVGDDVVRVPPKLMLARQEQELQMRLARELVSSCRALNRTIAELDQELGQRTAEIAPGLLELPGCAAVTAAKLAEIGPIDRFRSDAQLARHSGVAPLEASSGRSQRHRLDCGGNRQLNAALYRIAITQARYYPPARDYLERKRAEGKSRREALRCLKRLLVRVVFNTLKAQPALT
jgi:transposase